MFQAAVISSVAMLVTDFFARLSLFSEQFILPLAD